MSIIDLALEKNIPGIETAVDAVLKEKVAARIEERKTLVSQNFFEKRVSPIEEVFSEDITESYSEAVTADPSKRTALHSYYNDYYTKGGHSTYRHNDGSTIAIKHDKDFKGVHTSAEGDVETFGDKEDMKKHVTEYHNKKDKAAKAAEAHMNDLKA